MLSKAPKPHLSFEIWHFSITLSVKKGCFLSHEGKIKFHHFWPPHGKIFRGFLCKNPQIAPPPGMPHPLACPTSWHGPRPDMASHLVILCSRRKLPVRKSLCDRREGSQNRDLKVSGQRITLHFRFHLHHRLLCNVWIHSLYLRGRKIH